MKKIQINNFKESLYYEKLSNGLDVYLFPCNDKNIYTATYAVKYGGRVTDFMVDGKAHSVPLGIAHFLEHKMFEQEDGNTPLKFYAKNGANANASTGDKTTKYFFTGCDNFEENLRYLIKYVSNIYLTDQNVEKEKGIIAEEIKMYDDDPDCVLYDTILKNTFLYDSVRNTVGGDLSSIASITKEDLKLCYDTFYQPSNMTLVVGGPINVSKTLKIIKEEFERTSFIYHDFKKLLKEDNSLDVKDYEELIMDTINPKFAFSVKLDKSIFNNLSDYEIDYYIPLMLSLCFGNSSKFYDRANKEKIMYYFKYFYIVGVNQIALVFMGESKDPKKFIEELKQEISNLQIDKVLFERIKKAWIASEIRMIDSVFTMVSNIVYDIVEFGEYKNNKINDIRSLDFDILNKISEKILANDTSTLLILPKEKSNV